MFDKIFSFLGFNSSESLVGLTQLTSKDINTEKKPAPQQKKELKLSDLMRGL